MSSLVDKNGIPIIGTEDTANKKIEDLTRSLVEARNLVLILKENLEAAKHREKNLVTFLIYVLKDMDGKRFKASLDDLNAIKKDFEDKKQNLISYYDKEFEKLVVYMDDRGVQKEAASGKGGGKKSGKIDKRGNKKNS